MHASTPAESRPGRIHHRQAAGGLAARTECIRRTLLPIVAGLAGALCAAGASAAPGELDPGFGSAGRLQLQLGEPFSTTVETDRLALAQQPDGKLVIAGAVYDGSNPQGDGRRDFLVVRLNADGSLDTTFGGDGWVAVDPAPGTSDDRALAVLVQPDGRIVAAGYSYDEETCCQSNLALVRLNADGTLDTTFDGDGVAVVDTGGQFTEEITGIAYRPSDGALVVAGNTDANAEQDVLFARFTSSGQLDTTFGVNGVRLVTFGPGSTETVAALVQQTDGALVAVGEGPGSSVQTMAAIRLTADGDLDTSFDDDGLVVIDFGPSGAAARSVALQADGRLVLSGWAYDGGEPRIALARLNTDGSLDTNFGTGGTAAPDLGSDWSGEYAYAMVLQADGRIVVAGQLSPAVSGAQDFFLARFLANGSLDPGFGRQGVAIADFGSDNQISNSTARALLRQADGRLVAAGGGFGGLDVARFDATGGGSGGVLGFVATSSLAEENAGAITLTLRRTGGATGTASASLRVANTTGYLGGSPGCDFMFGSTTVAWADGDYADKQVSITIIDDTYVEAYDAFQVELHAPVGATLATDLHEVNVLPDNADTTVPVTGEVSIEPAKTVSEAAGSVTLTVTRSGGSQDCLLVGYEAVPALAGYAATRGLDFAATAGAVVFDEGDTSPKQVTVPIVNDALGERDEDLYVELRSPYVALGAERAVVTIQDDDGGFAGTIEFYYLGDADLESDGANGGPIGLVRDGGSNGTVGVTYTITSGTATAGVDFVASTGTITWGPGDTAVKQFFVEILEDTLEEDSETYIVTLSNPTGGAELGDYVEFTGTIYDNDTKYPGQARLTVDYAALSEDAVQFVVRVLREEGRDGEVSVNYATSDGTATAGADYTATSGTLTWADGSGCVSAPAYNCTGDPQKIFTIPIINDADPEENETLTITLSDPTNGLVLAAPSSYQLTILKSDPPGGVIAITPATLNQTVSETAGTVTITLSRTGGLQGAVTVDYRTVGNSATPDADFVSTSGTLTWADGEGGTKNVVVPIIDDALGPPGNPPGNPEFAQENFYVFIENLTGDAILECVGGFAGTCYAYVAIRDDESSPGRLSFSTPVVVQEDEGQAYVYAYRTGGAVGPVSVQYTTVNGTAVAPGDYTTTANTLSWAAGETAMQTIAIPITDDAVLEPDESFTLQFSSPTGGLQVPQPTATIDIIDDDDPGAIAMSLSTVSVTEANTTQNLTVTRSGGTAGAVSVSFAATDGTATAGSDYAVTPGTLSWLDGESGAKTITVNILDDSVEEPDETFAVTLSNPTGNAQLGVASTTVTIVDNDANPGTLRFTVSTREVSEAAATVQVDIERYGGSLGTVSVDYATANGTAIVDGDYAARTGTVSWLDGETGTRSFSVPIVNDTVNEPDETFGVTLANPGGGATLGTPASETITIANDDLPNGILAVTVSSLSVTEGQPAVLEVSRTAGSYGAVSVGFATQAGSAISPEDYAAASGTLSWADGDTASKTITVTTVDDTTDEPVESFNVVLSNPTGGAEVQAAGALVNITDNDLGPTGTLAVADTAFSVTEAVGTVSVVVTRTGGASGPATVNWTTQDFTALAPADYTAASGTLEWGDFDSSSKTLEVTVVNDTIDEPDEVFRVVLSGATGADLNASADRTAVTILDDDLPPVPGTLSVDGPAIVDEDPTTVTYTVTRTGGADGEVSVNYATSDGTATAGSDYQAASGTLTWLDGDLASKTVLVTILEDTLDEPNETYSVVLAGPTGGASLGTASRTTFIRDDDVSGPGSLRFVANVQVFETVGNAIVQVERVEGFDGAVSVVFATAPDTALEGQDYEPAGGTLEWADGEGGVRLVTVPIVNDTAAEPLVERFLVTLSGATGGATILTTSASVSITDDDLPGTIGFTQTSLVASETGNSLTLSVARTGGSRGAVSVDYAAASGTATLGSDFSLAGGTLQWADGDATGRTITVTLLDDALVEPDEEFTVTLSNPGGGAELGAAVATVTLLSDEIPQPGTIRVVSAVMSVGEAAGTVDVLVERVNGSDGRVTIDYDTVDGTATAADYTPVNGTLEWLDGATGTRTVTVAITNDTSFEPDETFAVLLANPGGGSILAEPSTTITIQSDDAPVPGTIAMADAAVTVNETAGTVTLTVTRTGGSDGAVAVSFATSPGTASAADFTATSGPLNWADGDAAPKTITVSITDDTAFEPDEAFTVGLSGVSGGATLGAATTVVTIVSADPPQRGTLAVASAGVTVSETAGTVTVSVTRTGGADGPVSIEYATADGTALAPADYTAGSGTLQWADGDATPKPIVVPVTDDTAWEPDETFSVSLSNPGGGATLGAATSTVTIESEDAPIGGTVAMSASAATVAEPDGSVTLSVTRTGGTDGTVSVNFATAAGTAVAADFTATSGTLTWANGDAAPKSIVVPITNDAAYEANETFTVTLSGLSGAGASLGTPAATTVTITSDDPAQPGTLAFASATATVDEFAGSVTLNVTRTGGADLPVGVSFASAPGTAGAADFTAVSGTLSWANGDATSKPVVVPIINDTAFEPGETFTVQLSGPTGGAALGAVDTVTVTIVSEDPPRPGVLALTGSTATVDETAGTITLTVTRTGGADGVVGASYATTPGTAASADFTATSGPLTWPDGDATPRTITVPITNDGLVEPDEAFAVSLANPTGGAALGIASTTITIRDDDILVAPGVLGLTQSAATVAETAGTVSFTVTRADGLGGTVSVQYATTSGTAEAGTDFGATTGTLTWGPGDATPRSVTVPILDDTAFEPDETFTVGLSNPGGGATLGTAAATVTIQSEDPPPDTTPDPFAFTDVGGVTPGAEVQSNEITVTGINTPAPISLDRGEFQVDGGAWSSAAGTVANGARVRIRVNASSDYDATVAATLTIGGVSDTFSVTTRPATTGVKVRAKGGGAVGVLDLLLLAGLALVIRRRSGAAPVACVAALLGCVALAPVARAQDTGFYLGAGVGQGTISVGAGEARQRIESATGETVTSLSYDESDTSFSVTAGYAFNRTFAVEAAYYGFGDTSSEVEAEVLDPAAFVEAMANAFPASVHGPALLARLTWPFAERWAAHLRAGVISWESEIEATIVEGGSGTFKASRDGTDPVWGAALSWRPRDRFAVSLEFVQAQLDDEVRSVGLGLTWLTGWRSR